jgi:eukaryotic-like serine/threonine-protein kinase
MSERHVAARRIGERTESSRYELIAKLASGGMGSVYVARSRGALGFENLVAVKRPHAHLLEARFKAMLVEEARIASRIRHANVVAVRDVAVEGSLVYLVMDYIEGASVAQLACETADTPDAASETKRDLLPVPVIIRICLDAAAGLHAAHEVTDDDGRPLDVVHRDVSPQNILVGTDGVARLTDFGIAKCFGAPQHNTAEGHVKGKLAYIAPEYARGEAIDRRADVFGLGVVLWELLTGRSAFAGSNSVETLTKILQFDPPAPSAVRPGIPAGVDAIVSKALSKDPRARQATAEELGETLEAAARAAGAVALHREVAAALRARVGKMLVRRASAVRAAMVEEGTVDLEEPAQPAPRAPSRETESAEVSMVISSSPETLRKVTTSTEIMRGESSIEEERHVVTPPGPSGGPLSVPDPTGNTLIASTFATPAEPMDTVVIPPRAQSEPRRTKRLVPSEPSTLPLPAPAREAIALVRATEPLRSSPHLQPAQTPMALEPPRARTT